MIFEALAVVASLALVLSARHSYRTLLVVGMVLVIPALAYWYLHPSVVTEASPPFGPAGYYTWPLPAAVAGAGVLAGFWRKFRKPGLVATLAAAALALVISAQGAWVS